MATVIWGNNGSVWTTTGNWVGGSIPVTADDVVINTGSVAVDGISQAAVDLASLAIGDGYSGAIGDSSSYLIIGCSDVSGTNSAGMVSIKSPSSAGDIYLDSGGTTAHDEIVIDSQATGQTIYLKASTTCPRLTIHRGNVKLVSGTFTSVTLDYQTGTIPSLVVEDGATVTSLTASKNCLVSTTGTAVITSSYIDSGTVTFTESATATNIYQRGGTIYDKSSVTTAILEVYDGVFDASGNLVGKTYSDVRTYGDADVNLDNGTSTISSTITSYAKSYPKTRV